MRPKRAKSAACIPRLALHRRSSYRSLVAGKYAAKAVDPDQHHLFELRQQVL